MHEDFKTFSQKPTQNFCENVLRSSCIASHVHYNYIFMHLDVCYIC